ncbi:hypothetical protein [Mangrovitalea sediminis]|uniref:hypothetical protein n=1 Tax=Mangrovitalea sediminis TaxID=1982043 RepID=UPI001D0D5A86|nr:hypothetical protein [Mangrovitalea sediminis]
MVALAGVNNRYCHYHPVETARWLCPDCQMFYCPNCIPDADSRRHRGACPRCGKNLRYLGDAAEAPPFWARIPAFFRYPLSTDPLLVIVLCTLVPLLVQRNLVGGLVTLALTAALLKYNFAVLARTAEGTFTAPPLAMAFRGGFVIVILQLLLFAIIGLSTFAAGYVGGKVLAFLVLAFCVLALPAAIMVLAMEQRLPAAINPLVLMTLITRIGWPYFVLYGHLVLLSLAAGAAQDFALRHFPDYVGHPVAGFLNSYFTVIFFNMLGYVLYQYQEALGYVADAEENPTPGPADRPSAQRREADIDMALKDGDYDRVQRLLLENLKQQPRDGAQIERLYLLLKARNDHAELYRQQQRLLPWLIKGHDGGKLADYLNRLVQTEPDLRLNDPVVAFQCAQLLYHAGEYRWVLRLLRDFHKRFPDYQDTASAYLLVARTLANGLHQWDKAEAFLRFIEKRCRQHPLQAQIGHYLAQVAHHERLEPPTRSK